MKWFEWVKSFFKHPLVVGILAIGMIAVLIATPYDFQKLSDSVVALALWQTILSLFMLIFFLRDGVGSITDLIKKDVLLAVSWAAVGLALVWSIPHLFNFTVFLAYYVPVVIFAGIYVFVILLAAIGAAFRQAWVGHLNKPAPPRAQVSPKQFRPPVTSVPTVKAEPSPTPVVSKPVVSKPVSFWDPDYSRSVPKGYEKYLC